MSGNGEQRDGTEKPSITPDRARLIASAFSEITQATDISPDITAPAEVALISFAEREEKSPNLGATVNAQATRAETVTPMRIVTRDTGELTSPCMDGCGDCAAHTLIKTWLAEGNADAANSISQAVSMLALDSSAQQLSDADTVTMRASAKESLRQAGHARVCNAFTLDAVGDAAIKIANNRCPVYTITTIGE